MAVIEYDHLTRRGQIRRMRRAAEQALALYRIAPYSLALLGHMYHTTFAVTGLDDARYVLHILRPMEDARSEAQSRASVESELWWLDRLRADLQLAVPVAVRTPGGDGVVRVAVAGLEPPRLCTLYRWIEGCFLRHRLMPAHLEQVGRLTARLHRHSEHLGVPAWFDRPSVDQADAEAEERVARRFADDVSPAAADVMRAVFRRVRRTQQALGRGPDAFGLIHADIHQKNYLFRAGEVRLLDFGDCGWGCYLYDLAVTISELDVLFRRAALRAALLAGYRRERDLPPAHEAWIDTFAMLREVQNLTWFLHERENPSYRSRTAQIGARVARLERLLGAGA